LPFSIIVLFNNYDLEEEEEETEEEKIEIAAPY
jgi:hypothetical protein